MQAPEAASDLALIERAVRAAGPIAKKFFGGTYRQWDKGKGQPVTEADMAVDLFLRETLRAARPRYGWLSEETADDPARLQAEHVFVVDPIDGTIGFMKGKPQFTICAAVVRAGRPIAGVILNPMTDECFTARQGAGAHLNGEPIHVSARAELPGCRMLGAKDMFAHPGWAAAPNTPWPEMIVETRSSIAYRMALVASGAFDATIALSAKRDWDLAAGDLIVQEAGGRVTSHDGTLLRYNEPDALQRSLACAGPALHTRLLEQMMHIKLPRQ